MAPTNRVLSSADAQHLLVRTGFSARPEDLAPFVGLTRTAAVERVIGSMRTEPIVPPPDVATTLLSFPEVKPGDEAALLAEVSEASGADLSGLKKPGKALFARLAQRGMTLKAWWLDEMVRTPSPLTERLVLVLHNHFTSSLRKVKDPRLLYRQNALFRSHAGGSYADLLHAIVDDPAMLVYLDASGSTAEAPNENLARELLELFSLGEGHYTEADVKAAARAFTGRQVRRIDGSVVERRRKRDSGDKLFLGRRGDLGPHDLVDVLLKHPRTARTWVDKLWRAFIADDVDAARADALATVFRAAAYDMKPLLRALLLEDAFWAEPSGLIRSPVDLAVFVARTWGDAMPRASDDVHSERLVRACKRMGQDVFDPPNVKGWPTGVKSVTTASIVARDQFLRSVGRVLRDAGVPAMPAALLDPNVQTR